MEVFSRDILRMHINYQIMICLYPPTKTFSILMINYFEKILIFLEERGDDSSINLKVLGN